MNIIFWINWQQNIFAELLFYWFENVCSICTKVSHLKKEYTDTDTECFWLKINAEAGTPVLGLLFDVDKNLKKLSYPS